MTGLPILRRAAAALLLTLAGSCAAADAPVTAQVPAPGPAAGGTAGGSAGGGAGAPPLLDAAAVRAAQPLRVAEATGAVRPGVPGEAELFAVLAAWYPNQRVFLREVEQAGAILAERFDAAGRVVTLASSAAEPLRHPLATPENLAAAVAGVAGRMDPEDVLLVYLTSHGVPGELATGDWWLATPPLSAGDLDALLDATAPANTAVVVSACRSGSFMPVVAAPGRLVITAAAADRNSFGCSDANVWTWFGKAFFDDALRATRSLPDAFARAAALVGQWEAETGEVPSQPQIALGARIGGALERLARDAGG